MRKITLHIVFFLLPISMLAQSGWDIKSIGLKAGIETGLSNPFFGGGISYEHFRQIKDLKSEQKFFYKTYGLQIAHSTSGYQKYTFEVGTNIIRKRLFVYADMLKKEERRIPLDGRKTIYVNGLKIYPVIYFSPSVIKNSSESYLFIRPGAGFLLNYGHLATWHVDTRLRATYYYNALLSDNILPASFSPHSFLITLGLGIKFQP